MVATIQVDCQRLLMFGSLRALTSILRGPSGAYVIADQLAGIVKIRDV